MGCQRGKLPPVNLNKLAAALLCILSLAALNSCYNNRERENDIYTQELNKVRDEAYVPVYGVDTMVRYIAAKAPRATVNAGKIYVYGNYLFQVEKFKGVHVIDYSDKQKPVKLGFITSGGCTEVAVKNGYLITNNLNDLVTIDIYQIDAVKEVARIKNAFPHAQVELMNERMSPPVRGVYYQCADQTKGDVIDWKLEKNVKGANCINR
jgi:hypothetical protein